MTSSFSHSVYSSDRIADLDGWKQPVEWNGPQPVLYYSLDNLYGLVLMEGTEQRDYDALIDGKVIEDLYSNAVSFQFSYFECKNSVKVVLYNTDVTAMCSVPKCKQSSFIDH